VNFFLIHNSLRLFAVFAVVIFFCKSVQAQTDSVKITDPISKSDTMSIEWFKVNAPYIVKTNDGGVHRGTILEENEKEVVIYTDVRGRIYIPKYAIKEFNSLNENRFYKTSVYSAEEFADPEKKFAVITYNSDPIVGEITSENEKEIVVKTMNGSMAYVPKYYIQKVILLDQENFVNGRFFDENFHPHNYMIANAAFLNREGVGRVRFNNFLNYNFNFRVNQNISLGINTSLLASPVMLNAKYNFRLYKNVYAGIEGMYGFMGIFGLFSNGGIAKGALTFGDFKKSFTINAGYAYYNERGNRNNFVKNEYQGFIGNASGMARLSNKIALTAELWYFQTYTSYRGGKNGALVKTRPFACGLAGIGMKYYKSRKSAWTFGVYLFKVFLNQMYPGAGIPQYFIPFPYVAYSGNFK
jgi:hypothetical protein